MDAEDAPGTAAVMCFACLTLTCRHQSCAGTVPAITSFEGTALCRDCARAAVDGLREHYLGTKPRVEYVERDD